MQQATYLRERPLYAAASAPPSLRKSTLPREAADAIH